MDEYEVTMALAGEEHKVVVKSNNVQFAIQNAIRDLCSKTGKSGWRYVSAKRVRIFRPTSCAERNRKASIRIAKYGLECRG